MPHVGLLGGLGARVHYRLVVEDDKDLTLSLHWPKPMTEKNIFLFPTSVR